jgi:hypothetical protein
MTLVLRPGFAALAPVQHLPVAGDRAYPDGSNQLYAPSDLVPMKPRADIVLVGRPKGNPSSPQRVARLAVGEIDKRIDAHPGGPIQDLGPVPPTSPARRALLGGVAARRPDDWDGRVLPEDLDPACFNVAPPDQQLSVLRGDERIVLENLHPEHTELVTTLPGQRPLALIEGAGLPPRRVAMRADTLWIDASLGIGALVWRGQVALARCPAIRVLVDVEAPIMAEREPVARSASAPVVTPRAPAFLQETVGLSSPPGGQRTFDARLPFVPSGPAPVRGPSVGGGLPFLPAESAEVSPWARGRIVAPRHDPPPVEVASPPERVPAAPRFPVETLQLTWFDLESAPRVRRAPHLQPILDAANERPPDPELDPPSDEGDLADREERRDMFEILARADALDEEGAVTALSRGVLGDGRVVQPVVVLSGELTLAFDEIEVLKAMMSAAARVAGADPRAAGLIAQARTFLGAPGVAYAPAAALALTEQVRAAALAVVPEKQRPVTLSDLDAEVKRGLLDARAFQRRRVLGAPHVRALFSSGVDPKRPRLPAYLPEALARALPRVERLRVRLLALVHPALDRDEAGSVALHPVALATVTPTVPA